MNKKPLLYKRDATSLPTVVLYASQRQMLHMINYPNTITVSPTLTLPNNAIIQYLNVSNNVIELPNDIVDQELFVIDDCVHDKPYWNWLELLLDVPIHRC
jgi:hypothetical protein